MFFYENEAMIDILWKVVYNCTIDVLQSKCTTNNRPREIIMGFGSYHIKKISHTLLCITKMSDFLWLTF